MNNNVIKNTTMLYLMNIAKIIFPLLSLPYLTRVLSVECYGVVSYVKGVMLYMQIIVDFGFLLFSTKEVVKYRNDKEKVGAIVGNTVCAKFLLALCALIVLVIMTLTIPMLQGNFAYTMLSFVTVVLSILLLDFLFQGIEKMEVITIRFVIMKVISTFMTFILVKSDADILLIPLLDIFSSLVAIAFVIKEVKRNEIKIVVSSLKDIFQYIKQSAVYFISDMAGTTFGALNTLLIGIYLEAIEVAYWNVAIQIVNAIQTLYNPIMNGIYPEMVKTKSLSMIKKILCLFIPIIVIGCIASYFLADIAILIVGGQKYLAAASVFRAMIPVLLFSFPAMLFGWPTLGAINKVKETTVTAIITAVLQVVGLGTLIIIGQFDLIKIALLRGCTEFIMLMLRVRYCWKNRERFSQ